MTTLQTQLSNLFPSLPSDIRELLLSETFDRLMDEMTVKYKLENDQSGMLARSTVRLLAGIIKPKEYLPVIISELEIDEPAATLIAQEVNKRLLFQVKDSLSLVHGISGTIRPRPVAEKSVTQQPPKPSAPEQKTIVGVGKAAQPVPAPPSVPPSTQSIFEQKLQSSYSLSPEKSAPTKTPPPAGFDPYRESV